MSMEAITKIMQTEEEMRRRRAEAEALARQIREDARQAGETLLAKTRQEAAEQEKSLLAQAEQHAQDTQTAMARETQAECEALRREGESHLAEAINYIVEKVVKN